METGGECWAQASAFHGVSVRGKLCSDQLSGFEWDYVKKHTQNIENEPCASVIAGAQRLIPPAGLIKSRQNINCACCTSGRTLYPPLPIFYRLTGNWPRRQERAALSQFDKACVDKVIHWSSASSIIIHKCFKTKKKKNLHLHLFFQVCFETRQKSTSAQANQWLHPYRWYKPSANSDKVWPCRRGWKNVGSL